MGLLFFGLDGEMSAPDIASGGRLIQIGIAAHEGSSGEMLRGTETFCSLIYPGPEYAWSPRAEGVHGFTREQIDVAPKAEIVDEMLVNWMAACGVEEGKARGGVIAVGFNVGSFDLPHLEIVLPRTYRLFSRRTVDLNALCFTLDGMPHQGETPVKWSGWKRLAKTYAERVLHEAGAGGEEHDAGFDALIHLHGWRFLRAAVQGSPLPLPQTPAPALESRDLAMGVLESLGAEAAAEHLGVHPDLIRGWAEGGRCTKAGALEGMRELLQDWP